MKEKKRFLKDKPAKPPNISGLAQSLIFNLEKVKLTYSCKLI